MRMINADLIQYEPMLSAKGNGMYEDVMVAYKSQIDDLPTIEERKTGKWIEIEPPDIYVCPFCKHASSMKNFCGECGADLRGESNETD